ncbi:MAG TPA: Nif11-like leader peptide family RiPP precursor [Gaiellaceae bacterium]|nr:Nif11-like leader peptide family RiPP precursor [Gaiellaceae bacterium]
MGSDAVVAFAERMKGDEALQKRLADAPDREARLAIVREEGFDLTHDDAAAVKRVLNIEELSDEDLDRVAGGVETSTSVLYSAGSVFVTVLAAAAFTF